MNNIFLDIDDRSDIAARLAGLRPDAAPVFGIMTPQHMVEHLCNEVRFSNGRLPQKLWLTVEQAEGAKAYLIYTDVAVPMGFKSPLLGDGLSELEFSDIDEAIHQLLTELDGFDDYFAQNPEARPVHPALNDLDEKEWIIYHGKHFTHHFKQFSLL
jgi:hypothetical protein